MKNEQKFIVYKHTSPDGKIYIGMTSKTLEERSGKHGRRYDRHPRFRDAIQKFGWENFTHEILEENLTEMQAREMEREMIRFYKSNEPEFGYNDTEGGEKPATLGKQLTEEHKHKISEAISGENAPWYGKQFSEEHKHNLSESHKGKQHREETKNKISEGHKGKQFSEEHKQHISEVRKGMKFTEEHKQHLSEVRKGKRWYNNGIEQICAFECPAGFTPGMLYRPRRKRK